MSAAPPIQLFLCGDVMTGRGIDQILSRPSSPELHEPYAASAADYVELALDAGASIPRPVHPHYVWGNALAVLEARAPDLRIVNLETSVTTNPEPLPKGINYRMHPANVPVLTAAGIDCCTLANNHVLDWGNRGLLDTLDTLSGSGIQVAGAGLDAAAAAAPAVLECEGEGRVLVFGLCTTDSGVPRSWAAGLHSPGVNLLPDLSAGTVEDVGRRVGRWKERGDVVLASIHWGSNWGYEIPESHRRFAHGLIEEAEVDAVYGHSSHHPKGIEVHRDRPILYGCGDFLNDYEGIAGREEFRGELVLMYFPRLDRGSGALHALEMVPLRVRNFRLERADARDRAWLLERMGRECARFGHQVVEREDAFALRW